MTVYFTADTHFGHEGIVINRWRQFPTVEAMDQTLIDNWNARVKPDDVVWHLGDFTLSGAVVAETYLRRLNGHIHLIWGNHDRNSVRGLSRWVSSEYAREIKLDGHKLTLCHYAMKVWNRCGYGARMLYGHSHGNLPGNAQSLDVGVDAWEFRPVTLPEILARMETLEAFRAVDHHAMAEIEDA